MEIRTLMEPVDKYYFKLQLPPKKTHDAFNREIRNWLGQNCQCTWETHWESIQDLSQMKTQKTQSLEVYFDLDSAEEDLMAFKLRWT